jgi:hypothetical protein
MDDTRGTVYLYPPAAPTGVQPWIIYKEASLIRIREVPVGAIEFRNKEGYTVRSTLPFTVVYG